MRLGEGLGTGLDDIERRKISPYRDSDPLALQPAVGRNTDCAVPAVGSLFISIKLKIHKMCVLWV
jgi:hypothetical protein